MPEPVDGLELVADVEELRIRRAQQVVSHPAHKRRIERQKQEFTHVGTAEGERDHRRMEDELTGLEFDGPGAFVLQHIARHGATQT